MTDEILNIILKSLNKESSTEENLLLERWLLQSESNQFYYKQFKKNWTKDSAKLNNEKAKAWIELTDKLEKNQPKTILLQSRKIISWAAVIVFVLFSGYFVYFQVSESQNNQVQTQLTYQTVSTVNSQLKEVKLPDNTIVKLNNNSRIEFPNEFDGRTRQVKLFGEAFFEVAHNAAKPFIVQTENFSVKVLGTSFNIYAYKESTLQNVSVYTGKVKLTTYKSQQEISLVKGESASLNVESEVLIKKDSNPEMVKWIDGVLVFDGDKFDAIVQKIERHFNVKFKITNKDIDYDKAFVGSFKKSDKVSDVLEVLKYYYDFNYKLKDKNLIIIN
ncbi:FecR family protein [Chondrinema litorale]|uniref:FecR family protein n=1 Tax=Chondrinema litorale TaxID=2994555 RepID=UPI002542CFCD|nr:FecR family protein [Chondrinema litorale]UZR99333.1 FecR domain-containing protein [Chondrinema litorale]